MPKFRVEDPDTGRVVTIEGDSAPNPAELDQIFNDLENQQEPFIDISGIGKKLFGAGEVAVQMGTAAAAEPAAGLSEIATAPFVGTEGAEEIGAGVRESLTFQPRTEAGQELAQGAGEFLAPVGRVLSAAETSLGDKVFKETKSPALAAAATTLPSLALELIGIGLTRGFRKTSKAATKLEKKLDKALLTSSPGTQELRRVGGAVFDEISDLGVTIKPKGFAEFTDRIAKTMRSSGGSPRVDKEAFGALQEIRDVADTFAGRPVPLSEFEVLRKIAQSVASKADPSTSRLGNIMIDEMDSFLESANPKQLLNFPGRKVDLPERYRLARRLWGQAKRGEVIAEVIDKARRQQSGFENGLRIQVRQLLDNKKRIKFFSKDERAIMNDLITGTKTANFSRFFGKLAPNDGISNRILNSFAAGGAGAFLTGTRAGAVILPAIGFVSSRLAERLTKGKAFFLDSVIRSGRDGRKITRAYFANTPKKLRNADELSELLLRQDIDLSNVPADAITTQAVDLVIQKRASLITATAGVATAQAIKNEENGKDAEFEQNPFPRGGQVADNGI